MEQHSVDIVSKHLVINKSHLHIEINSPEQVALLPKKVQTHIKKLRKLGYHLQLTIK